MSTDMLLIITSTSDRIFRFINIDVLDPMGVGTGGAEGAAAPQLLARESRP